MAWLNTSSTTGEYSVSRYKRMTAGDESIVIAMPPADTEELYLVKLLNEIGPASSNGMGIQAISYQEIDSWNKLTGIDIESWQATLLHNLSRVYAAAHQEYSGKACPAPFVACEDNIEEVRAVVDKSGKAFFNSLAKQQKGIVDDFDEEID